MELDARLSADEWNEERRAWLCAPLRLADAELMLLSAPGHNIQIADYEADGKAGLIRWKSAEPPPDLAIARIVASNAPPAELDLRWKKAAIVVPVVAALLVAAISRLLPPSERDDLTRPVDRSATLRRFDRSNDFLATGSKFEFVPVLKRTKREAWFVGTTFYITVDQFHDLLVSKLRDGVDLHFLILDPNDGGARRAANLLGVTEEEIRSQCLAGIKTLQRIASERERGRLPGKLLVKLSSTPPQSRFYVFDPKADTGTTYYVPQINGTNSQFLPGFLVSNKTAPFAATYFDAILTLWNGDGVTELSSWAEVAPSGSQPVVLHNTEGSSPL